MASPAEFPPPGATVSAGKYKMRIFEKAVEQDDEFAHDSGESELREFSASD